MDLKWDKAAIFKKIRRYFFGLFGLIALGIAGYFAFVYYVPYSRGVRSGELIKISEKGVLFKTWEGEMSQGISGAQIFKFSILDSDEEIINQLKDNQGKFVKVEYVERYRSFYWWGDTHFFISKVEIIDSPYK